MNPCLEANDVFLAGLLVASVIFNLPFAVQPMQRAFEAIAPEVREAHCAAACRAGACCATLNFRWRGRALPGNGAHLRPYPR